MSLVVISLDNFATTKLVIAIRIEEKTYSNHIVRYFYTIKLGIVENLH